MNRRTIQLALLAALMAAPALTDTTRAWEGRLEMADAPMVLKIEISADGAPSATLTGLDGAAHPTAIEDWQQDGEEVAFVLTGIERGYTFTGRLTGPDHLEGPLVRRPPAVPQTDLYLLEVDDSPSGWRFGAPLNITDRKGYDNQPYFLGDSDRLLYTSMRDGQADIYAYDLSTGSTRQITHTPESEYSPTPMPDSMRFSAVRVESDGTQRLWAFDLDGSSPTLLLSDVAPVGYHAWVDEDTVALFVLGEPPVLQIADLPSGIAGVVAEDIGRGLRTIVDSRGPAVVFVHKVSAESWDLVTLTVGANQRRTLGRTRPGSEDFAWTDAGPLMAEGSRLYRAELEPFAWREVADLSAANIRGITRLALSPDGRRLVVVAERPDLSTFPERLILVLRRVPAL